MFKERITSKKATLLEALKKMNALDKKLLIVFDDGAFQGLLSAGDIQRAIIQNKPLNTEVKEVLREKIRFAKPENSFEEIKKMMLDFRMELCPVVNEKNKIEKVFFWEDLFKGVHQQPMGNFNLPVVIMAGGVGTRLRPLTNVLPKPLIPVNEKTLIEEIFERFHNHGCNSFFISVNYKADLIEYYLKQQNLPYQLSFFKEIKPLGTAGSLSLLKGIIKETFFVSNCDILIEQDYSEILEYHRENNNELTLVAALKHLPIPYGTIETGENGQLLTLEEKPELTFKINSGMYILEPHLLAELQENTFYHITDLINLLATQKRKVGVFPVSQNSWLDIGDWKNYLEKINNA